MTDLIYTVDIKEVVLHLKCIHGSSCFTTALTLGRGHVGVLDLLRSGFFDLLSCLHYRHYKLHVFPIAHRLMSAPLARLRQSRLCVGGSCWASVGLPGPEQLWMCCLASAAVNQEGKCRAVLVMTAKRCRRSVSRPGEGRLTPRERRYRPRWASCGMPRVFEMFEGLGCLKFGDSLIRSYRRCPLVGCCVCTSSQGPLRSSHPQGRVSGSGSGVRLRTSSCIYC